MEFMAGTLYVVSTPIGNLEDLTYRAVRILSEADLIACEDTRHTRKLLKHYGIDTKTVSYHEHNEDQRATELLELIHSGVSVAIVSDAGTPSLSDPGFRIVRRAVEARVTVVPLPGATALMTALVTSGLPTDRFYFEGFLPARSNQRQKRLKALSEISATLIFYEAPHRIVESLRDGLEVLGEREAVVARELTKLNEQFLRGRLSELIDYFSGNPGKARGEMVVLVDRKVLPLRVQHETTVEATHADLNSLVCDLEAAGLDRRSALKKAAKQLGISRDEAYRRISRKE